MKNNNIFNVTVRRKIYKYLKIAYLINFSVFKIASITIITILVYKLTYKNLKQLTIYNRLYIIPKFLFI